MNAPAGEVSQHSLLSHRLILVTGKGGVGKSTLAAALAVAARRSSRRVLLVELSARAVSGTLLGGVAPQHDPKRIAPDRFPELWVTHLDIRRALQEVLAEILKVKSLARLAIENRVLARLWEAAPSVNEMAVLIALERFERAMVDDCPLYDLIVVDMPASGHAKSTLAVPRGALIMTRVGALAERARSVDQLLRDAEKTAIVVVTLAEELPVSETLQLADGLRDELDLPLRAVLVNALLPEIFDRRESAVIRKVVNELEGTGEQALQSLLRLATHRAERRVHQREYVSMLRRRLDAEVVEIGFSAEEGVDLVEHAAATFACRGG